MLWGFRGVGGHCMVDLADHRVQNSLRRFWRCGRTRGPPTPQALRFAKRLLRSQDDSTEDAAISPNMNAQASESSFMALCQARNCRNAAPRWLCWAFSSGVNSANAF